MCQSPPQGETLHLCPQELSEEVLLTCNESTLKNGVSAGGTEGSERQKDNGEGNRGKNRGKCNASVSSNKMEEYHKMPPQWSSTLEMLRIQTLMSCVLGPLFGASRLASEVMIRVSASKCGQLTRTMESWELNPKGCISTFQNMLGSELSDFLLPKQPSRPALQMSCLTMLNQDECQKPQEKPSSGENGFPQGARQRGVGVNWQ